MIDVCGSCGKIGYLPDGVICEDCEEVYHMGLEERSFVTSNMLSRKFPRPMSDPWDMV